MDEVIIKIPDCLCHSFFYKKGTSLVLPLHAPLTDLKIPFAADALYIHGIAVESPLERADIYLPIMLEEWKSIKEQLALKFEDRKLAGAEEEMRYGIAFALQFIHWMNDKTVDLANISNFDQWDYHPVNSTERIQFILSRPASYHSFIQLCRLIEELEKQYYKKAALKRK